MLKHVTPILVSSENVAYGAHMVPMCTKLGTKKSFFSHSLLQILPSFGTTWAPRLLVRNQISAPMPSILEIYSCAIQSFIHPQALRYCMGASFLPRASVKKVRGPSSPLPPLPKKQSKISQGVRLDLRSLLTIGAPYLDASLALKSNGSFLAYGQGTATVDPSIWSRCVEKFDWKTGLPQAPTPILHTIYPKRNTLISLVIATISHAFASLFSRSMEACHAR